MDSEDKMPRYSWYLRDCLKIWTLYHRCSLHSSHGGFQIWSECDDEDRNCCQVWESKFTALIRVVGRH